ncbi:hypothetical protein [Mycoplasma yeatsii]|uniref:Transmembrane protein n=1 Tax=Mycoplasma yeatsii TaxID=51365 RepID=A0ABU0NEM3_9MOLU|nr:hypothetical protein [Mycoplasma yeatsii]MDQ0567647.1 hypothetical protein [Mycoplasma yeatsii]
MIIKIADYSNLQWVGIFTGVICLIFGIVLFQLRWSYLIFNKQLKVRKKVFDKLLKIDDYPLLNKKILTAYLTICAGCMLLCLFFVIIIFNLLEKALIQKNSASLLDIFLIKPNGLWWSTTLIFILLISELLSFSILVFYMIKVFKNKNIIAEKKPTKTWTTF